VERDAAAQPPADHGWILQPVAADQREIMPSYRRPTQITLEFSETAVELEYFLHFFPVVYLRNTVMPSIDERARVANAEWNEITLMEYFTFLGLWLTMSIANLPDRALYWRVDEALTSPLPLFDFQRYMSKARFDGIVAAHCLLPIERVDADDPMLGARLFLSALNEQLDRAIKPGSYLCIDESMEKWLGRVNRMPGRRKIPRKPVPVGQEHKDTADGQTNIMVRLEISEEAERERVKPFVRDLGVTAACVVRLTEPWWRSGRTVIADSWFGSPKSCLALMNRGLFSLLMCKRRAGWPINYPGDLLLGGLEGPYGTCCAATSTSAEGFRLVAAALKDRKPRCIIGSCGITTSGELVERVVKNGQHSETVTFHIPEIFADYSRGKGAVDINNNIRSNMTSIADVMRVDSWEMRTFSFYVGVIEANAYLACRAFKSDYIRARVEHVTFRLRLAKGLLTYCERGMIRARVVRLNIHSLLSFPRHGGDLKLKKKYVQRHCCCCGTLESRFCQCDPSKAMCLSCFPAHMANEE
jgi:hypothetical protein